MRLSGEPGRSYLIEATDALGGLWEPVGEVIAFGGSELFREPIPAGTTKRFYRAQY